MLHQLMAPARQVTHSFTFCLQNRAVGKLAKWRSTFKKSYLYSALIWKHWEVTFPDYRFCKVVKLNTSMRDNPLFLINAFIQNKRNSCATIAVCKRRMEAKGVKGVLILPEHGECGAPAQQNTLANWGFHLLVQRQAKVSPNSKYRYFWTYLSWLIDKYPQQLTKWD